MKFDLARFGAWVQAKADRIRAKHVTVGGQIGAIVTIIAFLVVTLYPVMRVANLKWTSGGDLKKAMAIGWLPLLAAMYLKYSETFKRSRVWEKFQRKRRTRRQIITGKALKDLCVMLQSGQRTPQETQNIRESILQSAALGVEELLGLGSHDRVVANLLEFSNAELSTMKVVCRSMKERPLNIDYPRDNLVAWAAIQQARIKVVDDISKDPRWDAGEKKGYRTIAAVPVGFGGKACAAVSLDCEQPYAFYGRADDIAIQLEPYAAVLALTYGSDAHYHQCHYEPSRHV